MTPRRPLLPSVAAATLAAVLLAPGAGLAQVPDTASTVETTGSAEVTLRPTSALLRVGVSSVGGSAESAADSSSRKTRALRDTLTALGLDGDSLRTLSFSVGPYRDPDRPRPEPAPGEPPRQYEARALAREAGGRLGPLLHATSPPGARPGGEVVARALESGGRGATGVSLVPRDVVVEATVTARWSVEWREPNDGGGP